MRGSVAVTSPCDRYRIGSGEEGDYLSPRATGFARPFVPGVAGSDEQAGLIAAAEAGAGSLVRVQGLAKRFPTIATIGGPRLRTEQRKLQRHLTSSSRRPALRMIGAATRGRCPAEPVGPRLRPARSTIITQKAPMEPRRRSQPCHEGLLDAANRPVWPVI